MIRKIKILHVDDESSFLETTELFLKRRSNLSVDGVTSAEEGLELLKSGAYDVVVSDYKMPGMDGLEFLQNLRESESEIPFIMLTGKGREEVAMEALNRGANSYLHKGGDPKSLYGTLAHVIRAEVAKTRAEDKIAEMTKEQQIILDSLPLNIFHIDANSKFVHVNDVLAKLYGKRTEDFIGKSTREFFPREAEEYIKSDREILESGKPQIGVRRRIKTPEGVRWVRLDKVPLKDATGNVTGIIGFELDITERKEAEDALRESEEKYRTLVDNVNVGVYRNTIGSEGKFIEVNPAIVKMFCYESREEFLAMNVADLYQNPEDRKKFNDKMSRDGVVRNEELRLKKKDGTPIICSVSAVTVEDEKGKERYYDGIIEDITESKRAEEKLAKIVDGMNIPAFAINSEHKITHWNTAVESLTGLKREEIVGTDKQWAPFYVKKRQVMADLIVDEASESEFKERYGDKYKKSSLIEGAYEALDFFITLGGKWLLFTAAPLRDSEGKVIGAIETLQDITERKRAEEALRESEEKYRSLVESTEDSVYLVDRDCRYIFMNEKHLSRIGMPKDQVIGKTYGEFHSEEETKKFAEKLEGVLETGKYVPHEYRSRRDGKHYIRTLSPVKDSEGRTKAVTVIAKDITELKRVDEEREHLLNVLEAKNTELERFTYTVSHDLSSPLFAIRSFTDLIREKIEQDETENMESYLKRIEDAAIKMDQLLNDTLQLSRIGRVANPPEDVPFGAIVQEALEQTVEQMKSSGVELSVADDFPTVHVDRVRIAEVLVDLITNSVRYMGEQPHPKIEIGYRVEGKSKETVFFVRDNGIGIDPSQHEKVFELFHKLDKSSKGTGAGLAIVKRIVEVHNGRIWIESEKGDGCTVCFTLPAQ